MIKDETLILLEDNQIWLDKNEAHLATKVQIKQVPEQTNHNDEIAITPHTETVCKTEIVIPDIEDVEEIPEDSANQLLNSINFSPSPMPSNYFTFTGNSHGNNSSKSSDNYEENNKLKWYNFQIPWNKIPFSLLKDCESGQHNRRTFTTIIHIIVNAMRDASDHIGTKAFRIVAQKLIESYPQMFCDVNNEGHTVGYGEKSLHIKLVDRNNYLNRISSPKYNQKNEKNVQSSSKYITHEQSSSNQSPQYLNTENSNAIDNFERRFKHFDSLDSFVVPWHLIPASIIEECESGTISKRSILAIVHTVVNVLRDMGSPVPSRAMKIATRQIIDRYPNTFQNTDEDGVILGDGFSALFLRMQDRNNYLNRTSTKQKSSQNSSDQYQITNDYDESQNMFAGNDESSHEMIIDVPLNMETDEGHLNDEQLHEFFESTYMDQRSYIDQKVVKTVSEIKTIWPLLFDLKVFFWHFNKLTGSNIHCLEAQVENKFAKFQKLAEKSERLQNISKNFDINLDGQFSHIIDIVSTYFGEDIGFIYLEYDLSLKKMGSSPFIFKSNEMKCEAPGKGQNIILH